MSEIKDVIKKFSLKSLKYNKRVLFYICIVCITVLLGVIFLSYTVISRPHLIKPVATFFKLKMRIHYQKTPLELTQNDITDQSNSNCNLVVTEKPFYLDKDKKNVVQVRWEGMTGGELLKYYGFNYLSGLNDLIGVQYRGPFDIKPIRPLSISKPTASDILYVYTGSGKDFKLLNSQNFLYQDLENTLKKSRLRTKREKESSKLTLYTISVSGEESLGLALKPQLTDGQLNDINNILGSLEIFIQQDAPSNTDIINSFNSMERLSSESCSPNF